MAFSTRHQRLRRSQKWCFSSPNVKLMDEPWIKATILVPEQSRGGVLKLCTDRRGKQESLTYVGKRAMLVYVLPLNEIVFDFYDRLKSVSSGYASFDYQLTGYIEGDLARVSILVNLEPVDAFIYLQYTL